MPNTGVLDNSASINEAMDAVPDVGSPDVVKTNFGAEPDAVVLLLSTEQMLGIKVLVGTLILGRLVLFRESKGNTDFRVRKEIRDTNVGVVFEPNVGCMDKSPVGLELSEFDRRAVPGSDDCVEAGVTLEVAAADVVDAAANASSTFSSQA